MLTRFTENPLITPSHIPPSQPGLEVIGTFNAGAIEYGNEVLLLVRVAERPIARDAEAISYPVLNSAGEIQIKAVARSDEQYDLHDPRIIRHLPTGRITLTSMSHIRLARSTDGRHFTIEPFPFLKPTAPYESFGIEDARITYLASDQRYLINYSAVSPLGIATGMVTTTDFTHVQRHDLIFPPANRDVVIFPERINGQYVAYHRPMPAYIGDFNMWIAYSPDLKHWGGHRALLQVEPNGWESGRIGGGAPPIRTEQGWLSIYHAADRHDRYCLGAFLTSLDDPARIIGRTKRPILEPVAPYEASGFFPNVVFTCGCIVHNDQLVIYYGAADQTIAAASIALHDLVDELLP